MIPANALAPQVGDFLSQVLVTDTIVYEVVKVTAQTITVRRTRHGDKVQADNIDGNPYPVVYTAELPDPDAPTQVVRRRKDGTYRVFSHAPMHLTRLIDGTPVSRTDYRM